MKMKKVRIEKDVVDWFKAMLGCLKDGGVWLGTDPDCMWQVNHTLKTLTLCSCSKSYLGFPLRRDSVHIKAAGYTPVLPTVY